MSATAVDQVEWKGMNGIPAGVPTDLLDLSPKESSKCPVAFQKELCHGPVGNLKVDSA
jgi:hypothetical protein